ncbi:MAG: AI-2E family transporter [Acetivibrio sp.]
MELNKKNMVKVIGIITFTVCLLWGLNNYSLVGSTLGAIISLFYPFILGGCIAFVLNTPMKFLEKQIRKVGKNKNGIFQHKICRPLSLIATYLVFVGLIGFLLFTVIPEIGNTFSGLIENIQNFLIEMKDTIQKWTDLSLDWLYQIDLVKIDWNEIWNFAKGWLSKGAGSVINSTIGATTAAVSSLVNIALAFVFSIYILLQKEKLNIQSKKILYSFLEKKRADTVIEILHLSSKTFSNFLTGQCLEAVILGLLFFVSMTIFRFPYAMIISVLIAFMALIPIFGSFVGCAVGMFLIIVVNPMQALWFLILFLVIQQLEGNLIYPKVVGNSVGLPSMWVLMAVTLGASTMGVLGMLIFIPMFSILYTLLRGLVNKRLEKKNIKL